MTLPHLNDMHRMMLDCLIEQIVYNDISGQIIWANRAACRWAGLTCKELKGRLFRNVWFHHVRHLSTESAEKISASNDPQSHEFSTSDGIRWSLQRLPVNDPAGMSIGEVHIIRDITDRDAMAAALKKEISFADALIQGAPNYFISLDTHHRILMVNDTLKHALNFPLEQLQKSDFVTTLVASQDQQVTSQILHRLMNDHQPVKFDNRILTRHGAKRWVQWHGRAMADDQGKLDFIFIYGNDATEKKQMEAQLSQAHKMEAIGTLAGGIAHDFNNILTPVIIHTEMALSKLSDNSPMRAHLDKVLIASKRARNLIGQILAFSRPNEPKRRSFQVSPIVKEALKLLRASLPSTIEIRQNIEADSKAIVGDPTEIHQVLVNLCTNASHAMKKTGGLLNVELHSITIPMNAKKEYLGVDPGEYLELTVSDTGMGMVPEVLDRIFEPYFTTKQEGDGTGLGLARVHRIVSNYGGKIIVRSSPDLGSEFQVLLPTIAHSQSDPAEHVLPPHKGNERILFVDDEEVTVEAVLEMLVELGYKPVGKTDSLEALENFRSNPQNFHLVITDQTMPGMTGLELSRELLRIRPDIPIILSTGYSNAVERNKLAEAGIRGFLTKPYDMHEFALTIRKALDD